MSTIDPQTTTLTEPTPAPPPVPINAYAVISLVAALLGLFPVAIVFGVLAFTRPAGRGIAIAGLLIGILELAALLLAFFGVASAFTDDSDSNTTAASSVYEPSIPTAETTSTTTAVPTSTTMEAPPSASGTPIQPVPGTNKNKYIAGPFTVTLTKGITQNPDGRNGSEVLVENTSDSFTGYAQPELEYFQDSGVLGTNAAITESLSPGQQQTLFIEIQTGDKDVAGQWVNAQLITLIYTTDLSGEGTKLQLAH
ncbi:DUF4190 domain-containing protein (plasmid) [Gordonia amicalis]|nr:DUF4190 domain-containing protein [Gordonia amicalis]UOG23743.1 DUF4190 domain-containing protein [Gordonia amicalis]